MSDKKYENKCEACGEIVHTYMFEDGYGGHSYNHKTIQPYEDKRFNLPEREYTLTAKICLKCIRKEPSLHSFINKKRIEWFNEEIEKNKNQIKRSQAQIKGLEKSIPKTEKEIEQLIRKRNRLEPKKEEK